MISELGGVGVVGVVGSVGVGITGGLACAAKMD